MTQRGQRNQSQVKPMPRFALSGKDIKGLKVYYNSACPVCKAGIDAQRGKMGDDDVDWKDVHCDISARGEIDADLEFVRERLHVQDEQGRVFVGVDAFAALWERSPGEGWKATLLRLPVVHALCVGAYNAFARYLYRWNRRKKHW
jgi:predicted DCC family thiol-disulfide oxidoreductase YuxK